MIFCVHCHLPMDAPVSASGAAMTKRQREIVILLFRGLLVKQIAGELNLSVAGIHWHLERLYKSWGVSGRVRLLLYALRDEEVRASQM